MIVTNKIVVKVDFKKQKEEENRINLDKMNNGKDVNDVLVDIVLYPIVEGVENDFGI